MSEVTFSAQFGGRDAATAVLPHFKALKASAKEVELSGFPLPQLAYILRVDGEVAQYGPPGLGNPKLDKAREYVSVDMCLSISDRDRLSDRVSEMLLSSDAIVVATISAAKAGEVDRDFLKQTLSRVAMEYQRMIDDQLTRAEEP